MKIVPKFDKLFEEKEQFLKFHIETDKGAFLCKVDLSWLEDNVKNYNDIEQEGLVDILTDKLLPKLDVMVAIDNVLTYPQR